MPECWTKPLDVGFCDSNIFVGRPINGAPRSVDGSGGLLKEMDNLAVTKALVWHVDQYQSSPILGNELINKVVAGSDRLWGCWSILPPQTREVIDKDFFLNMKKNHIFGLRAFPDHHNYLLNRQVFGSFLDEAVERCVPLILSMSGMPGGTTWASLYKLLDDYPNLTCIVCDTGVWLTDRYTRPLLENYPNVRLETSLVSLGARVVEEMVSIYSAQRLVFGSGFPLRYPQAPMLQLLHAEISDEDRNKIASGNLDSLISKVDL